MSTPGAAHHIYRFGEFALDVERGTLLKAGADVPLRPKAFEVLRFLVERHGQLVSKDALLEAVWSPAVVTEDSVTQCLMEIRRAIDDHNQVAIRTLPRRGYLFDAPVNGPDTAASENEPIAPSSAPVRTQPGRSHRPIYLAMLALLLLAAWWAIAHQRNEPKSAPASAPPAIAPPVAAAKPSIAVLPFDDMSPGGDQVYFADGMAEEIIDRLVRIPGLRVIARTSSFAFKGQAADIDKIAARLNVSNVVEGSVRKSGDRLRITAQLIRTSDSSHLWSHTYDRGAGDALAIQDEIATAIAHELKLQLGKPGAARSNETTNTIAYEHFLQARFFFGRRGDGDLDRALEQYQLALHDDPDYARAWAGVAGVHRVRLDDKGRNRSDELAAMKHAVDRALALDPRLPEAQLRAANYYAAERHYDKAWEHYYKAKALDPNAPLVLGFDADDATWRGQNDEAAALWQRIVEQDPLNVGYIENFADYLVYAGRYEQAKAQFQRVAALDPRRRGAMDAQIGLVLLLQGKPDDALARIDNLPESPDRDAVLAMAGPAAGRSAEAKAASERLATTLSIANAVRLAEVHAYLGQKDAAFDSLQRARAQVGPDESSGAGGSWLQDAYASPFLHSLHADPRWKKWVASLPSSIRATRPDSASRPPSGAVPGLNFIPQPTTNALMYPRAYNAARNATRSLFCCAVMPMLKRVS
ncbi:MAG: winged helix-turn-helix domain-containing protein [Rhodanobacteraceae bacterium]